MTFPPQPETIHDAVRFKAVFDQEREAAAVLQGFLDPDQDKQKQAILALKPEPSDFERVFEATVASIIQESISKLWLAFKPPRLQHDCKLILQSAMSDEVPGHKQFPGGYRRLQGHLKPDFVWHTFKFVKRGESAGLAFDGLTRIDERFVWFPKPWRAVPSSGS